MNFLCLALVIIFTILAFYHLLYPFDQIAIFYLLYSGGEKMLPGLLMAGNYGEMWCCLLPKSLGTSQGLHCIVCNGQPHRDWLGKQ